VQGNVALLKLQSTESASGVIGLLSMRVTDNAESTTPDLIEVTFATAATGGANECASPEGFYLGSTMVTSGDITVVDAPPVPTTRQQCTNGGWQSYGVFKNQGDCVSFVATGGRNRPGGP
jgi:hypothetical protein